MSYLEIAAKKKAQRDSQLIEEWLISKNELPTAKDVLSYPKDSGHLSNLEIEITECNAAELFESIKARKWSAVQITSAFCHRSQIAHQLTNCLSEIFYAEGLQQAEQLDQYYEVTGKLKGPFHGIPVSLKDNINVINQASTVGFVDWCFKPQAGFETESAIAEILRDLGAVFYCKTNVPVAMMMPETTNHVYGTTTNPYNRLLSAGGSSGGGAAQAALKGSVIEIGSDIGGSIRIPGSFQGLYCLKPTFGRFPTFGTRSGLPGLESVNSVNGPLCSSLESAEFYLKTLADADPSTVDPKVSFQPWKPATLDKKLAFAILYDDGYIRPTPPMLRALDMVKAALEANGHQVIAWNPEEHAELVELVAKFFLADGGKQVLETTGATQEPLFPYMKPYGSTPAISVADLWHLQAQRTATARKFLDRWNATRHVTTSGRPIDAIIMAPVPFAGSPLGKFGTYVGYTAVFNALDYSAGVMPVTRADLVLDRKRDYLPHNAADEAVWRDYSPEETHGGFASVQVVCRRSQDEKVIELMKLIDGLLKCEN